MTSSHPVLTINDLTVRFRGWDGPAAVDNLSLTVSHGEVLALVGESGSGKTMTARSVLGLLPESAQATGEIRLAAPDDADGLTGNLLDGSVDWRSIRGRAAAMVFQEPQTALNPVRTIGWQLAEVLRAHRRVSRNAALARSLELLTMVDLADPKRILRSYPHQLSGGQKQRVVIALALAGEPALLIADEPTTALDVTVQEEILELLARLRDRLGTAILLITHNMGVVADLADRVLVMRRGRLVEQGEVVSLFNQPQAEYTRTLLAAVPRLPKIAEADAETGRSTAQDVTRQAGRPSARETESASETESAHQTDESAVRFDRVSVIYPGRFGRDAFRGLQDVTMEVPRGVVLGVVGESGSGKTTLARTAAGALRPSDGQVLIGGVDLSDLDRRGLRGLRRRIGFVQQDPATTLDPRLTVGDSIAEPFQVHRVAAGAELRRRIDDLLTAVALPTEFGRRLPGELSGGQRQRVALARALALNPDLLIADEPTSALDVSVQAEMLDLFADLQQQFGFACIFISHDLAVVDQVSDQIVVMRDGQVVESGPTSRVLTRPTTAYTKALLDSAPVPDPVAQRVRHARAERELDAVAL